MIEVNVRSYFRFNYYHVEFTLFILPTTVPPSQPTVSRAELKSDSAAQSTASLLCHYVPWFWWDIILFARCDGLINSITRHILGEEVSHSSIGNGTDTIEYWKKEEPLGLLHPRGVYAVRYLLAPELTLSLELKIS